MSNVKAFAAHLEDLIRPDCLTFPETQPGETTRRIILREQDDKHGERFVTISGVPDSLIAVKLDAFDLGGKFVRTDEGRPFGRRCDYVLLDPEDHRLVFVELKLGTSRVREDDVVAQLKGGRSVVGYLVCLLSHFKDVRVDLNRVDSYYLWITFQLSNSKARKRESQYSAANIDRPRKISEGRNSTLEYRRITA